MPETAPEEWRGMPVPEDMPDKRPGRTCEDVPERKAGDMSGRTPERIPGDMPYRLPKGNVK